MQCCTCSKWVHLKCSLLSFSRFRTLGSSHSWSCTPRCVPVSSEISHQPTLWRPPRTAPACIPPLFNLGPLMLMQHFLPILAFKPLIPLSAPFVSSPSAFSPSPHAPGCLSHLLLPLLPLTPSGFFNGMQGVSGPGSLNFYTFFCPTPLTLSVSRNPTLSYLSHSGSLNSLL